MEKSVKNQQKQQIRTNQIGCVYDLKGYPNTHTLKFTWWGWRERSDDVNKCYTEAKPP